MSVKIIADKIFQAQVSKVSINPIRNEIEKQDLQSAYKIQEYNINRQLENGQKIVGKKIGLTSKKVQAQLGVNQPDFGILLDNMQIENDAILPYSELQQPKAEAEIAFILKKDLTESPLTLETVIEAVDYAVAAIEIVGSRIKNWDIQITDTIADNASSSHFVLGKEKVNLNVLDLETCEMQLYKNGNISSEGNGKACLGNPLNAVLWLAQKMKELGQPLQKNEIILSGALGPMVILEKGDQIKASISKLGDVSFQVK